VLLEVRDLKTYFYRRGRFGVVRKEDYVPASRGELHLKEGETSASWEKAAVKTTSDEPFSGWQPRAKCSTRRKP
jgi:hypothetical protein